MTVIHIRCKPSLFAVAAIFCLLAATVRPALAADAAQVRPRDDAAIRVILQRYEDAWNAHDPRAFSQIFAPDAEFTNVRGVASSGPEGIAKAHTPLFAGMFRYSHQHTVAIRIRYLSRDIASVEVRWHMTGALDYTGKPRPPADGIRDIVLIRRRGIWRIIVFHNMELPPALARIPRPVRQ